MFKTEVATYPQVDSTVGSRLVLGFIVPADALQLRLPRPWLISPAPPPSYAAALGASADHAPMGPNLLLVFNDLLLNQDEHGRTQADASARYVGFNIPEANPGTGQRGMVHFRIFTGNPRAVPGRYHDALLAQVRHESQVIGDGTASTVSERWELTPDAGGSIELQIIFERSALVHVVGDRPDFPVWAAADMGIIRVYQEDALFEVIRNSAFGVDHVRELSFRLSVPEFADLFNGQERLVSIFGNPHYTRRVFSPVSERVALA